MFKLKADDLAPPRSEQPATEIGALLGAIIGGLLVYIGLPDAALRIDLLTVVMVVAGAVVGLAFGIAIGGLIDLKLTPKIDQAAQRLADGSSGNRSSSSHKLH
jgi:hypothetical protein